MSKDAKNPMAQAQQIWSMLDDMASTDPSGYKKFIEDQIKQGATMAPQPVMCIQTTVMKPKKGRLFINFFQWSRVPKPKSDDEPIPVVGCDPIWGKHNADDNIMCVAFNEDVTKYLESTNKEGEREALINLALDFLCDHHSASISRTYTIIQGEQVHGDLKTLQKKFGGKPVPDKKEMSQMLKENWNDIKIPGLEQFLSTDENSNGVDINNINSINNNIPVIDGKVNKKKNAQNKTDDKVSKPLIEEILTKPKWTCEEKVNDNGCITDVYSIELPGVSSVKQCELEISPEKIQLLVPEMFAITLPLSNQSDDSLATAKFVKNSSTLVLSVPRK